MTYIAVAVGALAFAGGAYVALRGGDPTAVETNTGQVVTAPREPRPARGAAADGSAARASGIEADLAALGQEVMRLRAAVADLRRQVRQSTRADAGEDGAPDAPRLAPEAQAREERRQRLEMMERVDARFRQEAADTAWGAQTASKVSQALEGLTIPATGVRDLDCRGQTCRIELAADAVSAPNAPGGQGEDAAAVPDPSALEKNIPLLALQLGDSLPNMDAFQVDDGHGGTNTVLYFSRAPGPSQAASGRR